MASIRKLTRKGKVSGFGIRFVVRGEKYGEYSCGTKSQEQAEILKNEVEKRVFAVENSLVVLDSGVDIGRYCLTGYIPEPKKLTITDFWKKYCEEQDLRVKNNDRKIVGWNTERRALSHFIRYVGDDVLCDDYIRDYRTTLLNTDLANTTKKNRLALVKNFVLWLDENELYRRPGFMRKYSRIHIEAPIPQYFEIPIIHYLLYKANPYQTFFILFALNTGATYADLHHFNRHSIKDGVIDEKRTKTKIRRRFRLWKPILDILSHLHWDKNGDLLRMDGTAIFRPPYQSYVKSQWESLLRSKHMFCAGWRFKDFRKTGANLIQQHFTDKPYLTTLYLAHSTKSMIGHYADPQYVELDNATEWLFQTLDLPTTYDFS